MFFIVANSLPKSTMAHDKLVESVQQLLNEGKTDDVVDLLFQSYLLTHPSAQNIKDYRDRVSYKLKNEFDSITNPEESKAKSKLLFYGFMTLISNSEGETGYNIVLLLLHLIKKGQHELIREFTEIIKLERASNTLRMRFSSLPPDK